MVRAGWPAGGGDVVERARVPQGDGGGVADGEGGRVDRGRAGVGAGVGYGHGLAAVAAGGEEGREEGERCAALDHVAMVRASRAGVNGCSTKRGLLGANAGVLASPR